MNYIEPLTKEEKSALCQIITGKEFKELFKRYEQDFSKIQKGFRAKSLTEQHALSIAITNIDKPFIAIWVNTWVEHWLKEIEENITQLKEEGLSHGAALATTMLDSFFANHVALYFKLTGNPIDADACSRLYERMEDIKSERRKNAEVSDRIKAMEEENRRLSQQVEKGQQIVDTIKAEYEEKILKFQQDNEKMAFQLAEAQDKISELQTAPSALKNDDADYIAEFDDTDTSALPPSNGDEITSLCCVYTDHNGQKGLIRYADLNSGGTYNIFRRNEDIPPYFSNHDKLFFKDGPATDGFCGIWAWYSIPKEENPSKDYILSRYNTKIDAIEIATIAQASSLDSLVALLKEGVKFQPHSRKVLFSFYASKGRYMGILCTAKDFSTVNGKTMIAEDCIVVPVYEFSSDAIMRLDNGQSFYRKAFAGLPSRLYHLKSPLDIVKDIVLSSISWTTYKTRDITRPQYRAFRDFIGEIPVDDVIGKIGTACRCSNPAAKELLDEFLNIVWKYVDGGSLEDKIILSAISANSELQEKAKTLIRKDWEAENESLLTEARNKLNALHAELKSATERLTEAQEAFNKTKAEDERLSDIIAEKEQLAENVEKAVAERVQKAQENAAEFIASMAFVSGQPVQTIGKTTLASDDTLSTTYQTYPATENLDELAEHHTWADVINTAVLELAEAGVAERYTNGLAAFLCAAYMEKQPIFLVGPNAIDIAQAFSAAVTANKHGLLCCEGSCTHQMLAKIGVEGENMVIINNLLASSWMNRLPEILAKKDIFYIATHPYAEDIQVEPKSLYGFMLPLFTEFLVDKKATGKYYGGYFADDFKPDNKKAHAYQEHLNLSKFTLSPLVRTQINRLAATMHSIYPAAAADDDFMFCIFPIAYASIATAELTGAITDSQNGIAISANLKRDLRHVLGEI